jgi:hypothetical protein
MDFWRVEHPLKMSHLRMHTPIEKKMLNIKHDLIVKKKNKVKINNFEEVKDFKMIINVVFKERVKTLLNLKLVVSLPNMVNYIQHLLSKDFNIFCVGS